MWLLKYLNLNLWEKVMDGGDGGGGQHEMKKYCCYS